MLSLFFPSRFFDSLAGTVSTLGTSSEEARLDCESRRMSQFVGCAGRDGGSASISVTVSVERDSLGWQYPFGFEAVRGASVSTTGFVGALGWGFGCAVFVVVQLTPAWSSHSLLTDPGGNSIIFRKKTQEEFASLQGPIIISAMVRHLGSWRLRKLPIRW